ncbi:helix-turn-helix transcriptional regulator [Paenibacillus sp. MER 180]|uniref:helix-turn-helix domain-containing protein n=1 Tax=Paenibacillus sp. MER 180 TaxID=2939570 RepID=UPI00203DBE76|nr:helix-turn-helix transcriptional regulator [Paenibacillus sp. MER 180]MCM3293297.1 helix-turn-helix transcriptional regulator [Paenibacillus sp. MER 180]
MDAKIISTIGELIQDKRRSLDMTITQLSELSGVPRGTISRIENGEVKRPEFSSVHLLATALNIPFETLVDYYAEIEKKAETLLSMLQSAISEGSNAELIKKVATKYLESPNEDSIDLTEKLYQQINSIEDTSIKLSLYNLIIDYSRSHGIMPYIAKGLYQRYLIERYDFSKLKETYQNGKYVLQYVDFLSSEERVSLYYKLAIHAYTLNYHNECIDYCKKVLKNGDSHFKADALGVLIDAYFSIGAYTESELYLLQYKDFSYPHTKDNVVLMDAFYMVRRGETSKAEELLLAFLQTCSNDSIIPASKQLLQLYLQQNNIEGAKAILENERATASLVDKRNALVCATYADYLWIKAEYYKTVGDIDKSIEHMVECALWYSKIDNASKEKEALNTAMHIHFMNNVSPQSTLDKLRDYYHRSSKLEGLS